MKCAYCEKSITERHIVHHEYYCSSECAINALMDDIITNAKEQAIEEYHENVEVIPASVTRCKHCDKPLALNETAWASMDGMYCSYTCGVDDARSKYNANEYRTEEEHISKATKYFDDISEEINREDYGVEVVQYKKYAQEINTTFVFEQVSEGNVLISRELIGYWEGPPTEPEELKLKKVFVD